MRRFTLCTFLLGCAVLPRIALSQEASTLSGFSYCTFTDEKQVSVRYNQPSPKNEAISNGKLWMPGGSPMQLFTETPLVIGNAQVPIGAYNVYLIPGKEWTLVVNKNVTAGAPYNEQQDLARAPMPTEKLGESQDHLTIYFAHVAPKQCEMRVDYGKTRATAQISEK